MKCLIQPFPVLYQHRLIQSFLMPYFFYPFLCVLFVLLVIFGIVPKMGGIKKAYERVEKTGKLWPILPT